MCWLCTVLTVNWVHLIKKVSERDKVQGARNAITETVQIVRRGYEYRATLQFARATTYSSKSFKSSAETSESI